MMCDLSCSRPAPPVRLASIRSALGQPDKALESIRDSSPRFDAVVIALGPDSGPLQRAVQLRSIRLTRMWDWHGAVFIMLTEQQRVDLRQQIEEQLRELDEGETLRREGSNTVELDQTRTGRLSRMDALQGQAMAKATAARAQQQVLRLRAALRRLDDGSYGDCVHCDEPIAPGRLQADPAAAICIDCAEKREA